MNLRKLGLAAAVASSIGGGNVLAQETEETTCAVGRVIDNTPFCMELDPNSTLGGIIHDTEGNIIANTESSNTWNIRSHGGYTVVPRNDNGAITLVNEESKEVTYVSIPENYSVKNINNGSVLIYGRGSFSVIDFEGFGLIPEGDIIYETENGFRGVRESSELSDWELNALLESFLSRYNLYIKSNENAEIDKLPTFNWNRNSIVQFLWNNRTDIMSRKEQIPAYDQVIQILEAGREHFDTTERIVGAIEGRRMLEDKGYGNFVEYYDAFQEAGIIEAFGYSNIDNESPFGEDQTSAAEKERIAKSILFIFRSLNDPPRNLMLNHIFPEAPGEDDTSTD